MDNDRILIKKRDHAADVANNIWLAVSYQDEIDKLTAHQKVIRKSTSLREEVK
jgi:hypothetical protein